MVAARDRFLTGCSKRHYSHPPNPGAPRRAVPRPRPQQAKRRGGTYQASLEPLASITCERIGTLPPVKSVEPLSAARTKLGDFFNILSKFPKREHQEHADGVGNHTGIQKC